MGRIEKIGLLLFLITWPAALAYLTHRDTIEEFNYWILTLLIVIAWVGLMAFLFSDQEININIQDR